MSLYIGLSNGNALDKHLRSLMFIGYDILLQTISSIQARKLSLLVFA